MCCTKTRSKGLHTLLISESRGADCITIKVCTSRRIIEVWREKEFVLYTCPQVVDHVGAAGDGTVDIIREVIVGEELVLVE